MVRWSEAKGTTKNGTGFPASQDESTTVAPIQQSSLLMSQVPNQSGDQPQEIIHLLGPLTTVLPAPLLSLLEHNLALPINFVIGIPATLSGQFSKPKPWLMREIPTASFPLKRYASLPELFPSSLKLHCSAPFGGMNLKRM